MAVAELYTVWQATDSRNKNYAANLGVDMGLQVTASKTELFFQCTRPFDEETPTESEPETEAMLYGTAFHLRMYRKVFKKRHTETPFDDELIPHVDAAFALLTDWLGGNNPWHETFTIQSGEQAVASKIGKGNRVKNRPTTLDLTTHHYQLYESEFGGTPDLIAVSPSRRLVVDYKTGMWGADFHAPDRNLQMRTLALQTDCSAVAILHAPRALPPAMYASDLEPNEAASHARTIRRRMAMIGDGSLRPGPACTRCPARTECPAFSATLLRTTSAMVKAVTDIPALSREAVDPGKFHMLLSQLEALVKRARAEIRERVRAGEVIERPDGKVITLTEINVERLSKKSILAALGPQRGEALLEELRAAGALVSAAEERMIAK